MELENLWEKQKPLGNSIETIRKDVAEGRVPELPFYIVGQQDAKAKISDTLQEIDGQRMQTILLRANYGVGKTNMLKYLDLYFKQHPHFNVKVIYQTINESQRDMFMILLRLIQFYYAEDIQSAVMEMRDDTQAVMTLVNNYNGEYAQIKEFVQNLFSIGNPNDRVEDLICVGTGQLYSVRSLQKLGLRYILNNYDRRVILELFLNILAKRGKYIIFALDEMENMYNISPKRLSLFLTTYRDLIDMFNKIKGHVLVCAITEAVRLEVVNEPFYSRVSNDIVDLFQLTSDQDILDLMKYLQSDILVECHCDESELTNMATAVGGTQRISPLPTRELVRVIVSKMKKQRHFEGLKSYLASNTQLQSLYNETMSIMEKDGSPGIVAKSFFDPLSYYLVATGLSEEKPEIDRRDYQSFIDTKRSRAIMFTFGKSESLKEKIQGVMDKYGLEKVVLFASPENGDVTFKMLEELQDKVTTCDYVPEELLTLLEVFRTHIEAQEEVAELIHLYTQNNL